MAVRSIVKICVVLPAFNEESVIKTVLQDLPKTVTIAKKRIIFTKVVVDDGSTDHTAKVAQGIKGTIVIQHPINMGPGAATRTGLHFARNENFDLAVTMDADGQHTTRDLLVLVKAMLQLKNPDLLIGGRLTGQGNMPLSKKIGNRILSYMTFLVFGVYVSDSQSGFRVLSKDALQKLNFNSNNYAFCSEMLWQAKRAKLRVTEYPIEALYTNYSMRKGQKNYSGALQILQQILIHRFMDLIT